MPDARAHIRVALVIGVAGAGKTTVGRALAHRLAAETAAPWAFADADAYHSPDALARMAAGDALTDADRAPWLTRLAALVRAHAAAGPGLVLACSALKKIYREQLSAGTSGVALVYLKGDAATLTSRLAARPNHYMKAGMLESQLAVLEEPSAAEGFTVGIESSVEEIVSSVEVAHGLLA